MTVKEAARRLGVTRPNLSRILNGRAGISAVMSVRLAKAMPYTSREFWLKMQLKLRPLEGPEKQAAKNQAVSRPTAKRPRFSLKLAPSPT